MGVGEKSMLKRTLALAFSAAFVAATFVAVPVYRAHAEMAAPAKEPTKAKKESATKDTKSDDKSGMTGAERRKKCSEEWKAAKAAGKTAGQKWPQFYSACNTRLKGG
jgi:hypothetical protein